MCRENLEKIVGAFFLAAFIAADFLFGITTAVRVAGITCLMTGAVWLMRKSIPVGWEGRPPSFFLHGTSVFIAAITMAALGVTLLLYAQQTVCLLGWADGTECERSQVVVLSTSE